MLYDTVSQYPDGIDNLIFFQDVDLEHLDLLNNYQNLISHGKYDDANAYIDQQTGIHGSFAGLFNLIENREYALQKYLLENKNATTNPHHFSETEPDIGAGEIWND